MTRYKISLEYDGTNYMGWQVQKQHDSIQQRLQQAIYSFCQIEVLVYGSGRTDAGVHALGQVAHFDLPIERDPYEINRALNYHLKDSGISVLDVTMVPDSFHARFSAVMREYCYDIINRHSPPAIMAKYAWHVPLSLDTEAMRTAATHLIGTHDFTSFRSSECQSKSPHKTLDSITIEHHNDNISIYVRGRSFLHNQVRIMVGNLVDVGLGKKSPNDIKIILEACDRTKGGRTAPAHGLFFMKVEYPTN